VVIEERSLDDISYNKSKANKWLSSCNIKAFYTIVRDKPFHKGARFINNI